MSGATPDDVGVDWDTGHVHDPALRAALNVCDVCDRFGGRHSLHCIRFVVQDFADIVSAELTLEEELRARYSRDGILAMVQKEFERHTRGGRVSYEAMQSDRDKLSFLFDDERRNRCRYGVSRDVLSRDRDEEEERNRRATWSLGVGGTWPLPPPSTPKCLQDAARDAAKLLAGAPCPHSGRIMQRRATTAPPEPDFSVVMPTTTAVVQIELFCGDCGSAITPPAPAPSRPPG